MLAVPTLGRRLLAWSLEVALLTTSVIGPFYLGRQLHRTATNPEADLAPTLTAVQTVAAQAFGLSPRSLPEKVTPLTNILWSASLGLPLVLAAAHIYSLSRYGRSWPKQWMGLQVLALNGQMPGLRRTLLREVVGKWASPLLVAYGFWRVSGAFPVIGLFVGLGAIALIGESLTGLGNRPRRAFHDWLAGTCVVDHETGAIIRLSSLWEAETKPRFSWGLTSDWAQSVGPTSVVINPSQQPWRDTDFTPTRIGLGLGVLLILGGLLGVGSYYLVGRPESSAAPTADEYLYADLVATLTNPELDPAARRAAVLALGNLPDDRVTPLLVDLIAQTDDPLWLDALQQALVARGTEAFPPLRRLNQSLAADLAMQGDPTFHRTLIIRLQTVNRIVTKLLLLEEGDRPSPHDLSRMHFGFLTGGNGDFRLVLRNQDLSGIEWQGSILTQAQLQGAKFYNPGADDYADTYDDRTSNLSGADLTDANLSGANLTLSRLVNAGLLRTNFNRANLSWADLSGANLEQANLIQAILNNAQLVDTRLSKADLTEAQLIKADLAGARFAEVNAAGAQFIGADLQNITANAATLTDADFSNAILENSDFSEARLQGANFRNANLVNANLRDADLRDVWFQGANLAGADFGGAIFAEPSSPAEAGFVEATPQLAGGNQFDGVDFSGAHSLQSEQLTYICAQGGIHPACSSSIQD
jgi:uncharacterized protein YjbI with pentapeptide repeats/uncharacterized RDD family membrane protein YckC